jgi:outer membrane receptor for ferrienterochelin and colicin
MAQHHASKLSRSIALALGMCLATATAAQQQPDITDDNLDDTTVTFPASYFDQYSPVSVNDMVNVIPGVNLSGGGPRGGSRRGLGSGQNEILINGQRMTGKSISARDQLSRIPADQVEYIEIIRGASEDLDVRNSGQTLNVVLKAAQSLSSVNTEINMDRSFDGTVNPGGKLSISGQSGRFNYLVSAEAEPRYENRTSSEVSYAPDYSLLETREQEQIQERTDVTFTTALSYQFTNDLVQLNGSFGERQPPTETERLITDFTGLAPVSRLEREQREFDRYEWEIGGDWEHSFENGSKYRFLFIVNDQQGEGIRERFQVNDSTAAEKDLYLYNLGRDRERIVRTSYTFNPAADHGLEVGIEGAQTIRNNGLRLGLDIPGTPSDLVGGLVPISINNAFSEIEEMRYETFAVHNWRLNDRMTLESTLIFEQSEITQTGDVFNQRDFEFVRPKVDYRFNITPSLQLRASIERQISQLSFSDFSATSDNSDDDKNTEQGNPDIVQEKSWVYDLAMEYRLPNNIGVLNSSVYYRDVEDVIDRIDVTTDPNNPQSARGNIGDAQRWGMRLGASSRLGYLGLPNALITANLSLQDSSVIDPFLGIERRLRWNSRGFAGMGFRHDLPDWNMNYGFNLANPLNGGSGRTTIDVDDIEIDENEPSLSLFVEKRAFGGTTFRFETRNTLDSVSCRERIRYLGKTVDGIVEEIENSCNGTGRIYSLKIRRTF